MKLKTLLGQLPCLVPDCRRQVEIWKIEDEENDDNNNCLFARCTSCDFEQMMPKRQKPQNSIAFQQSPYVEI